MYAWGDDRPYHSYAAYCRRTFGRPMLKLSVDGGFTCPNRDGRVGRGGCSFCLNEAFVPRYCNARLGVRRQLEEAVAFHRRRIGVRTGFLAYFQAYSSTYAPLDRLRTLYEEALSVPRVEGIVVATRPDCVDDAKLDYLAELARRVYVCVEFGIESTDDDVLRAVGRGHDFATACRAVEAAARRGIAVGGHLLLGLPGQNAAALLDGMRRVAALPLTTVKFHQLQLLEGTRMAALHASCPERFPCWTPDEYVDLVAESLRRLSAGTAVERIVSRTPPRFRSGSAWGGLDSGAVWRLLEKRLVEKHAHQGYFFVPLSR